MKFSRRIYFSIRYIYKQVNWSIYSSLFLSSFQLNAIIISDIRKFSIRVFWDKLSFFMNLQVCVSVANSINKTGKIILWQWFRQISNLRPKHSAKSRLDPSKPEKVKFHLGVSPKIQFRKWFFNEIQAKKIQNRKIIGHLIAFFFTRFSMLKVVSIKLV